MIEKEYYRISELKERFNISVEDIKYLVENSKIELVFHTETNQYIFGGWLKGKGFIGYGSMYHRGLIKISDQEQHELVLKDKLAIKYLKIINQNINPDVNHDYPYESPLPNNFMYDWRPKHIKDITWDYLPAKLFHEEKEHHHRTLGNMFDSVISVFDTNNKISNKAKNPVLDKVPLKGFYHDGIQLTFADSCILHSDLIKLNLIKPKLTIEANLNTTSIKASRPIDTLLINIFNKFPNDKPTQVWEKLKADLLEEPRLLDVDEIIDEIGDNLLYWFDNKSELKQMKKKSFYNLIRELKIN